MRLLVVEDDRLLGDGIRAGLAQAGFAVDWVEDGRAAELALDAEPYALVVLDLGLPRRSGLEVLAGLRARGNRVPVLILTARDTVTDRVGGLDAGADDYLVKPFDLAELTARVRALVRRSAGGADPVLRVADVTLDPVARAVTRAGRSIDLAPREFALLHELMRHAGRVLSRERLERSLYPWDEEPGSNAIEVHVHHLRRKLGADLIRTRRGAGYVIERPPAEAPQ
ncbi:MAG: response regulator [Betaproteobacteria bacterium]